MKELGYKRKSVWIGEHHSRGCFSFSSDISRSHKTAYPKADSQDKLIINAKGICVKPHFEKAILPLCNSAGEKVNKVQIQIRKKNMKILNQTQGFISTRKSNSPEGKAKKIEYSPNSIYNSKSTWCKIFQINGEASRKLPLRISTAKNISSLDPTAKQTLSELLSRCSPVKEDDFKRKRNRTYDREIALKRRNPNKGYYIVPQMKYRQFMIGKY